MSLRILLKHVFISSIALFTLTAAAPTSNFDPTPTPRPTHSLSTYISASPHISEFSIVNLQKGAELTVSHMTQGCFSSSHGSLKFSDDGVTYQGATKPLSMAQAIGLDVYFQQLAAKTGKVGGCTTTTDLFLTLRRNGEVLAEKTLLDDFCFIGEGAISPGHIRYDVFEKLDDLQMSPRP